MPRLTQDFKACISKLEKKELEKLVLKVAGTNKEFHDFLLVNYVDSELGEEELFEEVRHDIELLKLKRYKGYADEQKVANCLQACNKRIGEFAKVSKNKILELELILELLNYAIHESDAALGTCFTKFDHQVYLLVKKAITLVEKKIHEDLKGDFAPVLNDFLVIVHKGSKHLDYIHDLPEKI